MQLRVDLLEIKNTKIVQGRLVYEEMLRSGKLNVFLVKNPEKVEVGVVPVGLPNPSVRLLVVE